MFEAAKQIGSFDSWTKAAKGIVQTAGELASLCQGKSLEERRQFVYGGLTAFNAAYGWDMTKQDEETENKILWMFTQLYVR